MEISVKKETAKKMSIKEGLKALNVILASETTSKNVSKHDRQLDHIIIRSSNEQETAETSEE